MNKKSDIIKLTKYLKAFDKLVKESYSYDDMDDRKENQEILTDDEEMPSYEDGQINRASETINQIRNLSLQGIQDYANDVDSKEYDFFKKIWLMCDKVCSDKENDTKNED